MNITYPFYLSNETDALINTGRCGVSYCGYPGLAVRCNGGDKAVLRLGADNYTVSRIDYESLTVSLAYADAGAATGCPSVNHNVAIPAAPGVVQLFLRASTVDYLFFFVDCAFGPNMLPVENSTMPSIKPITCGGDADKGSGAASSFVISRADVPPGDWSRACRAIFQVPVLKDAVPPDAQQDPAWRSGGYGEALRAGFQVGWERSSGRCGQCELSNGKCAYSRGGEFQGCLCVNGRVGSGGCSDIASDSELSPGTYVYHSDR